MRSWPGSAVDSVLAATTGLIRSLKDREPAVRIAAMNALVSIASSRGGAGAIDPHALLDLLAEMLGDRDDGVRMAALDAIGLCGSLGSDDPPAGLVAALEDPSARYRAAAVKALVSFRVRPRSVASLPPSQRGARRAPGSRCVLGGLRPRYASWVLGGGDTRPGGGPRESRPDRPSPCRQGPRAACARPWRLRRHPGPPGSPQ